jgi:predicted RND superfamily exporter protein
MIIVDIFVIVMLVITIVFCIKLNKRITIIQQGKKDLAYMFKHFDKSISKADEAIKDFQGIAKSTNLLLEQRSNKAKQIIDELAYMMEKANKEILRIENNLSSFKKLNSMTSHNNTEVVKDRVNYENNHKSSPRNDNEDAMSRTKRFAIEDLLSKISEIQKKAHNNK